MGKFKVNVIFEVEVEIDESKFDEKFMEDFRASFYQFQDIGDHVEHLAQLEARGLLNDFTEGYGTIKNMGIKAKTVGFEFDGVERIYVSNNPA